jgi:hypothetical protein
MNQEKIKEIYGIIEENIEKKHVGKLNGSEKELFLIGEAYPGVWLEHVYDNGIQVRCCFIFTVQEDWAFYNHKQMLGE